MFASRRSVARSSPILFAAALMLLGAWVFFVPLVGPYFTFGFQTEDAWAFTGQQWILSLGPGIAAFAAGVLLLVPRRNAMWAGGMLGLLAGAWLVLGPTFYPVFSSTDAAPLPASRWTTAALWIGYFYGTGALILYVSALAQRFTSRSRAVLARPEPRPEPPSVVPSDEPPPTEVGERPREREVLYP